MHVSGMRFSILETERKAELMRQLFVSSAGHLTCRYFGTRHELASREIAKSHGSRMVLGSFRYVVGSVMEREERAWRRATTSNRLAHRNHITPM